MSYCNRADLDTGKDPRTRRSDELNVPAAFRGNADHKKLENPKLIPIRRVKGIQFDVKATGWEVLYNGVRLVTVGQLSEGGFRISDGVQNVEVATVAEMIHRVRRMAAAKLGTSEELLLLSFDGGNIHVSPPGFKPE
ncbi:MAG: hypothetical protein Q4D98_09745, partial [Planctomycetia bacterium]|nr:hypothetical protein [Planctomycetia bacterium]